MGKKDFGHREKKKSKKGTNKQLMPSVYESETVVEVIKKRIPKEQEQLCYQNQFSNILHVLNMAEKIQITAKVHGHVQGVCFRYFVKEIADKLNLQGYVRNLADSNIIEIQAVGKQQNLEILITNLNQGPPYSMVTEVEIEWSDDVSHFNDFIIRY